MRVGEKSMVPARAQSLRNPRARSYGSPCAQVFCNRFDIQMLPNLCDRGRYRKKCSNFRVATGVNCWSFDPQPVTRAVFPHGCPNTEVNGAGQGARMDVAFGKRTSLADEIAVTETALKKELVEI